jgi:hypothetical protein
LSVAFLDRLIELRHILVWDVFRYVSNSASKEFAQLVKVVGDGTVSALIDHLRECHSVDASNLGQLRKRYPPSFAELLFSKKLL